MYSTFVALMQKKGVKTADVSKATGVAPSTFTDWKKGRSTPKQDKLQKIAEYFNVTVDFLLNGTNDPSPVDVGVEIQKLINYLTDDNSSYCYGEVLSEEGKLALLNSLKQDKEFLTALTNKDNK